MRTVPTFPGQDETIDWSKFERASVDNEYIENYEYVNENEYTNAMKELYIPVKTEDEKRAENNANPLPKKVNIKDKIKQAAGKANAVKNSPVKGEPKKAADVKMTRAEMIAKLKKNVKNNNAQKK